MCSAKGIFLANRLPRHLRKNLIKKALQRVEIPFLNVVCDIRISGKICRSYFFEANLQDLRRFALQQMSAPNTILTV
jgi:hypothetical protein